MPCLARTNAAVFADGGAPVVHQRAEGQGMQARVVFVTVESIWISKHFGLRGNSQLRRPC